MHGYCWPIMLYHRPDHKEMSSPPQFKFKLLSSFPDPLTRQLAEAVRIEKMGAGILNSKSEYSRCRVPRLRIDMKGWTRLKETQETEVAKDGQVVDEQEVMDLEVIEEEKRRLDSKRFADNEVEESRPKKKRTSRAALYCSAWVKLLLLL